MNVQLEQHLKAMGANPKDVKNFDYIEEDDLKKHTISMIVNHSEEFANHILNKDWVLTQTTSKYPYIISDHPVTLHNEIDHGFYGNIGFAVKGIQINMPLSDTLSL